MKWSKEYTLGVKRIDSEHDALLRGISNIEQAIEGRLESYLVLHAIGELRRIAASHFESEESMMRACGYAQYDAHQRAHRHFLAKLEEIEQHTLDDIGGRQQLAAYLREWFKSHLVAGDKELAEFVLQSGGA